MKKKKRFIDAAGWARSPSYNYHHVDRFYYGILANSGGVKFRIKT